MCLRLSWMEFSLVGVIVQYFRGIHGSGDPCSPLDLRSSIVKLLSPAHLVCSEWKEVVNCRSNCILYLRIQARRNFIRLPEHLVRNLITNLSARLNCHFTTFSAIRVGKIWNPTQLDWSFDVTCLTLSPNLSHHCCDYFYHHPLNNSLALYQHFPHQTTCPIARTALFAFCFLIEGIEWMVFLSRENKWSLGGKNNRCSSVNFITTECSIRSVTAIQWRFSNSCVP